MCISCCVVAVVRNDIIQLNLIYKTINYYRFNYFMSFVEIETNSLLQISFYLLPKFTN